MGEVFGMVIVVRLGNRCVLTGSLEQSRNWMGWCCEARSCCVWRM